MNTNPQFPEHEHLNCPRCNSNNTKFCYFNNYNLTQPRHYCKNCRRYWTKGGTLRKIPIGGTTRKPTKRSISNKRPVDCSPISSIPPVQLNPKGPELAPVLLDLNRNDFVFNSWRSNSSNYRDSGANLTMDLTDGCVKEELKKTSEIDVFQMKCLGGKNDRKGESSGGGGDGGENRWHYFSVFVSGSAFVSRT